MRHSSCQTVHSRSARYLRHHPPSRSLLLLTCRSQFAAAAASPTRPSRSRARSLVLMASRDASLFGMWHKYALLLPLLCEGRKRDIWEGKCKRVIGTQDPAFKCNERQMQSLRIPNESVDRCNRLFSPHTRNQHFISSLLPDSKSRLLPLHFLPLSDLISDRAQGDCEPELKRTPSYLLRYAGKFIFLSR